MLYKKNSAKVLDEQLFKNPTAEYRGAPFWAWNCELNQITVRGTEDSVLDVAESRCHGPVLRSRGNAAAA